MSQTHISEYESEQRLDDVVEKMFVDNIHGSDLVAYIMQKYNVSRRQAYNIINKAKDQVPEENKSKRNYHIQKAINNYERWIAAAEKENDYDSARKIQDSLNKLLGLNEPIRKEETHTVTSTFVALLQEVGEAPTHLLESENIDIIDVEFESDS